MSPRGGVNRHLKLILQIKALNTIVSNQPVRPVWQTGQTSTRLRNRIQTLRPVRLVEQTGQTGPTQNLHKSVNPPLYELYHKCNLVWCFFRCLQMYFLTLRTQKQQNQVD